MCNFAPVKTVIQHTEQLLSQHDCVTVPGLGAFIVNYVPAAINMSLNRISAPKKVIYFNADINHNDGLLANAVSLDNHVDFQQATTQISDEVGHFLNELKTGRKVPFGHIGMLQQTRKGKIEFTPPPSFDFLPANLGMADTSFHSLQSAIEDQYVHIERNVRASKGHFFKYAAASLAIIALIVAGTTITLKKTTCFAGLSTLFSSSTPDTGAPPAQPTTTGSNTERVWHVVVSLPTKDDAETLLKELQKNDRFKSATIVYASTEKPVEPPAVQPVISSSQPATEDTQNGPYFVVVATYESMKKANGYIAEMKKTDPAPLAVYGRLYYYPIVAGSFSTKEQANEKLKEIRQKAPFKTAIIVHSTTLRPVNALPKPSLPAAESQKTAATGEQKNAISPAQSTQQTSQNELQTSPATTGHYYVTVASYETEKAAKTCAEEYQKKCNCPLTVVKAGSKFRVCAASYPDLKSANEKAKEVRQTTPFKDAWVAK